MRGVRLTLHCVVSVVVAWTLAASLVRGQSVPDRPYAALTRMPSLAFELWPADANEDDVTDLIAGRAGGDLVVRIGVGDGTFLGEQVIAQGAGMPIGVGDLNHDGHVDVIASSAPLGGDTVSILPGRGDGTFGSGLQPGLQLDAPAYVVDVDRDGVRDLIGLGIDSVRLYPGRGDFTFDQPVVLHTSFMIQGVVPTDLNGDMLVDVAAITGVGQSIDLFLNQGAFTFASSRLPLAHRGLGVTARDMNADGLVDLVASVGDLRLSVAPTWISGFVLTFLGHGDGTFDEPLSFVTNNGPRTVVAGDFNGDGVPDVATGNLSYGYNCEAFNHLWDSVSLLPGLGDGRLGAPASYALGNSEALLDTVLYRRAHHRLNTSDLNADGRTDLIASPGAILIATPPYDNRPPVADAGDAVPPPSSDPAVLQGSAVDPDNDWLTFEWTDSAGRVVGDVPRPCVGGFSGDEIFTLTVRDGHGGVSTDSVAVASSPSLPSGWASDDIGATTGGRAIFLGSGFAVTGNGADIWGTSDAFQFVHSLTAGNFDVTVQVTAVGYAHDWTKAGLMIREGLAADARHAFVFVTPSANGTAFQRRTLAGDATAHTAGPAVNAPVWLRFHRQGDQVSAFVRASTDDPWTLVGTETFTGLSRNLEVGMAVTSHDPGATATATFGPLSITPLTPSLPAGWAAGDIGSVAAPGVTTYDGSTFIVRGSGADIWDTADAFHYAHTPIAGNFDVVARVAALDPVHEWSKAGLMLRDGLSPQARHAFVLATPSAVNGVAFQRRVEAGEPTIHTWGPAIAPPAWLRLQRDGDTVRAFARASADADWILIDAQLFTDLPDTVELGIAVTSHVDGVGATAIVDGVGFAASEWTSADVGTVGVSGATSTDGGTVTVRGSGHDIWEYSDAFRFVHQTLSGDGSVTARVASLQATEPWAKAGVMIRASTDAASAHAFMLVSGSEGLAFQRRVAEGAFTTHTAGAMAAAPYWVRLTRSGDLITAFASADGVSWVMVGSDSFPSMPRDVLAGVAVTSHDNSVLATAVFDQLAVSSPQAPGLSFVSPTPGTELRRTTITFAWAGIGDEFWLDVGTSPGSSNVYSSGSLGQSTQHTVSGLPLNGSRLYVQLRRRIGTTTDTLTAQYTAPVFRALAVITDFQDRHLEDYTGPGIVNETQLAQQLRAMEDHWTFLSRGLERVKWEIMRIELPYSSPASNPDPFQGDWIAFRNAVATEILKQVSIADYDVNGDGVLDASWAVVSHSGLNIASALGGSSRHDNVNMFVDGQASASVISGATGNFNHELAHLRGLRDTYGTFDTLHGLTLMSFSWPLPPHDFSAFERLQLGWVKPLVVTGTTRGIVLPSAHEHLAAVMVPTARSDEYFLIEYRVKPQSGYGSAYFLPYNGLAVYHVFLVWDNSTQPPLIKLEPADGTNTYDGVLHADDFVSPDNPALLRPMPVRSYVGAGYFQIENVEWREGGIGFDIVFP
jgi:M6 family metalloprotease-like protein